MRHTLLRTLLPACVCLGAASTAWADGSATTHMSSAAEAGERASALTGITVEDMDRLLGVGDISFSPDGAWVLYSVTASNVEEDLTQADLWRVAWQGGAAQRLTFTESDSEWMPRWSPQGNRIAFLSDRGRDDGLAQIWIMAAFGGEARQVGEFRGGAEDFDWSPDGTRLVVVARDPERDEDEDEPANPAPIVIDRFGFKEDVTGYLTDRRSHLYLLALDEPDQSASEPGSGSASEPEFPDTDSGDTESGGPLPITEGAFDDLMPSWSPDGTQIAFVSKRDGDPDRSLNTDVYLIAPTPGAKARKLTEYPGADAAPDWLSRPRWSADSKQLTFPRGGEDRWMFYAPWQAAVVDIGSGASRLPADIDRNMTFPQFSADGRSVYALVERALETQLERIDLRRGSVQALTSGPRFLAELALSNNDRIALVGGDDAHPYEVLAFERGKLRPLTHHNDWVAQRRLAGVEAIRVPSSDGIEIDGLLLRPTDPTRKPPYPLVIDLHGGPVYQFSREFIFDWQAYAHAGFAVLALNPRGSSGRGFDFARAIFADWGNKDVDDVRAAIDFVVARGDADPQRIGVGGWSYGGILTNYVIAREPRIRAAVSGAGASHMAALYGHDQYSAWYELEFGPPWQHPEAYRKVSYPFFEADRIRAATLFQCGELDFNVPCQGAEQMYQALRSRGVPTQLVVYPGENHSLWVPSYLRDRMQRDLDWFRRHLLDAPAED